MEPASLFFFFLCFFLSSCCRWQGCFCYETVEKGTLYFLLILTLEYPSDVSISMTSDSNNIDMACPVDYRGWSMSYGRIKS